MATKRKLQENGTSLAVNIPSFIIEQLNLKCGDYLDVDYIDRRDGTKPFIMISKSDEQNDSAYNGKTLPEPPED